MTKKSYVFLIFIFIIMLFVACKNNKESVVVFYKKHVCDDTESLNNILLNEYDLIDLEKEFFNKMINENITSKMDTLKFSDLDKKFPVEVIRTTRYSAYKVKQGGYYFVFWTEPYNVVTNTTNTEVEPEVYFATYIINSNSMIVEEFDSLDIGSSTAEDVKEIDPYFELSFLRSCGIYSYSYLNEDSILEIEYTCEGNFEDYEDLIVSKIQIIDRKTSPSKFALILEKDLP